MQERGPIQLIPPGLLSLLQLKADGRSVSNLTDTCVPSLEMRDWWLRATAQLWPSASTLNVAAGTSAAFSNFTTDVLVPAAQWWYVHDFSVLLNVPAAGTATNVRLVWAATSAGTIQFHPLADGMEQRGSLLTGACNVMAGARDFWLPPGGRLGIFVDVVTGAGGLNATVKQLRTSVLGS